MADMPTLNGMLPNGWRPRRTTEQCWDCLAEPGQPCRVAYGRRKPDPSLTLEWAHMQRAEWRRVKG